MDGESVWDEELEEAFMEGKLYGRTGGKRTALAKYM